MEKHFSNIFNLNGYLIKIMKHKKDQHIGFKSFINKYNKVSENISSEVFNSKLK